jgi:hypothetical protein
MIPYLDRGVTWSKRVAMTETDVGPLPLAPKNYPPYRQLVKSVRVFQHPVSG